MEILPQLLVNALIAGSIYALASSGLALMYSLGRILNFAHGHMMMLGAYLFYWFHIELGIGLGGSAIGTAIFMTMLAEVSRLIFVKPFLDFSPLLVLVTTLALGVMFEAIVSMLFGVSVKSLSVGLELSSIEIGPIFITPLQIIIISSAIVLLSLLAIVVHRTALGRKLRAVASHREASSSLGISTENMFRMVFIGGSLLAAFAGIMVGYETNMQPTMGSSYTIKAFAAMMLGGLGNVWGTVLGSYLIGLIENLSIGLDFGGYSLPAGYKDAISFVIILGVLLVRPQGLFGRAARAV